MGDNQKHLARQLLKAFAAAIIFIVVTDVLRLVLQNSVVWGIPAYALARGLLALVLMQITFLIPPKQQASFSQWSIMSFLVACVIFIIALAGAPH